MPGQNQLWGCAARVVRPCHMATSCSDSTLSQIRAMCCGHPAAKETPLTLSGHAGRLGCFSSLPIRHPNFISRMAAVRAWLSCGGVHCSPEEPCVVLLPASDAVEGQALWVCKLRRALLGSLWQCTSKLPERRWFQLPPHKHSNCCFRHAISTMLCHLMLLGLFLHHTPVRSLLHAWYLYGIQRVSHTDCGGVPAQTSRGRPGGRRTFPGSIQLSSSPKPAGPPACLHHLLCAAPQSSCTTGERGITMCTQQYASQHSPAKAPSC